MKTSELTGAALDWAVGIAEGFELNLYGVDPSIRARVPGLGVHAPWAPQRYWNQGGPIIEREKLAVMYDADWEFGPTDPEDNGERWMANANDVYYEPTAYGPTPLIAAMRCYVASKLGDEFEIPQELK